MSVRQRAFFLSYNIQVFGTMSYNILLYRVREKLNSYYPLSNDIEVRTHPSDLLATLATGGGQVATIAVLAVQSPCRIILRKK